MAQEACKEAGGTIATYTQLSYAQQVALPKKHNHFRLLYIRAHYMNVKVCLFSYACPAGRL